MLTWDVGFGECVQAEWPVSPGSRQLIERRLSVAAEVKGLLCSYFAHLGFI